MTPAEWLALLVLASIAYNVLESLIAPDAVKVKVSNAAAGFFRICFSVAIFIAALVVLF